MPRTGRVILLPLVAAATGAAVFAAGSMTSVLALMASGSVALWLWGRRVGDPMLGPAGRAETAPGHGLFG